MERPNLFAKLSKPIKQLNIIPQQPNKINVYTKSKALHRTMLQLDQHILPKIFLQQNGTKIVISKTYDEQNNPTKSSIKNKLFDKTKKLD